MDGGYEDWINKPRAAIENLINLDSDIKDALDNEPSSAPKYKGLLDSTHSLNDFSIDELELERVSDALAQNGAETQAAHFAIDEIANLSAFRSHAASRSIDTDYSTESTRLIKNQFLIEGGAALLPNLKFKRNRVNCSGSLTMRIDNRMAGLMSPIEIKKESKFNFQNGSF